MSTAFTFSCDLERQKTLQSPPTLAKDKLLTVQRIAKGTFFRVEGGNNNYRFIVTNRPLGEEKMTPTEMRKNIITQFEFHEIKRVYAA